jgi:hypothetical protein
MDLVDDSGFQVGWLLTSRDPPTPLLAILVKGSFRLTPGGQAERAPEQIPLSGDVPESADPAAPPPYPSDFAPFKPAADVLVTGTCYAPGGAPAPAVRAGIAIGPIRKSVEVFGDRYWTGEDRTTQPRPFERMRLGWRLAYGGPGFAYNPIGKGREPIRGSDASLAVPLPNIESPGRPMRARSDAPLPAGFGPLPDTWAPRIARFGTYGADYVRSRWPWYPADLDWGFFNSAPADQQVQGYLRGDEDLLAENLSAATPLYRCRLPGLAVRACLTRRQGTGLAVSEVPMCLDTLWCWCGAARPRCATRPCATSPISM